MQRNCIFPGRYAPLTYYEDEIELQASPCMQLNTSEVKRAMVSHI